MPGRIHSIWATKSHKASWLQAREALWSNCKRTQSSESRYFLCKKYELLLRALRSNSAICRLSAVTLFLSAKWTFNGAVKHFYQSIQQMQSDKGTGNDGSSAMKELGNMLVRTRERIARVFFFLTKSFYTWAIYSATPYPFRPAQQALRVRRLFFSFWPRGNWGEYKTSRRIPFSNVLRSPQCARGKRKILKNVFVRAETLRMRTASRGINPFTPKSDQFEISPAASTEI